MSLAKATTRGAAQHLKQIQALEDELAESQAELARLSGHLTPAGAVRQLAKIGRHVRAIAVHLKPSSRDELVAEIEALGTVNLEVGMPGTTYSF